VVPATAADPTAPGTTLSQDDAKFIIHALQGDMLEIKTSELALKRGLAGAEREFAQKMIDDHTAVDAELKTLAEKKGVTPPTQLGEKMQDKVDKLGKESDKDFAEAYLECQISAHKMAISAYKEASEEAKDPDVKAFAAKHLPHLTEHLETAKALEKKH
jgi:putative membrane protein